MSHEALAHASVLDPDAFGMPCSRILCVATKGKQANPSPMHPDLPFQLAFSHLAKIKSVWWSSKVVQCLSFPLQSRLLADRCYVGSDHLSLYYSGAGGKVKKNHSSSEYTSHIAVTLGISNLRS